MNQKNAPAGPAQNEAAGDDMAADEQNATEADLAPTFVDDVFGEQLGEIEPQLIGARLRDDFAPWHHPVKQVVRHYQWLELTEKLLRDHRSASERQTMHYFTLPGRDLLDVRVLAGAVNSLGTRIEYFGFDAGGGESPAENSELDKQTFFSAEAELRQSGLVTDLAEVLPDRLEDIAVSGSQAANRLEQKRPFDVINLDACQHLAYEPKGRQKTIFNALQKLLEHQLGATKPWLLFLTTRVDPERLGAPAEMLKQAIKENLSVHKQDFGDALADCLGGDPAKLDSHLDECWQSDDEDLLKVYSVGLGKYLLQFFHAQLGRQAKVELVSAYAYKISKQKPEMLSLAFRVRPKHVVMPATAAPPQPDAIELNGALKIVARAKRLWDLDEGLEADDEVRELAVEGTKELLGSADYDLAAWREWLADLPVRPVVLTA